MELTVAWIVIFSLWGCCLWMLIGLGVNTGLSYAITGKVTDWADFSKVSAKGFKTDVLWHAIAWPLVIGHCKSAEDMRGHWCRWVDYPDGRYTHEQSIAVAVDRSMTAKYGPNWNRR